MIKSVVLKNWRSHLESKFEFLPGTNILLGSIGSGKSSVLDAICFAFFGIFPSLQSKKIKLDDVIMRKPVEKDRAEVEVQFVFNGKEYSIKRVIERGKGTTYSEIREDGKLLEAPHTQRVNEIVEEILKIDYDLFSKAVYSEQNALDYFLTIPKGHRREKIDELLGIKKFEEARSASVSLRNRISDRKIEKENIIRQVNEEELKKNIFQLEEEVKKLSSEKENLKKILEEVSGKRRVLEEEVKDLKKVKEELEILKREEKGKESVLEETIKIMNSIEEAVRSFSKEGVERSLKEFEESSKKLEKELKEKKEEYEKIFSEISKAESSLKILKEEKLPKLKSQFEEKTLLKKELEHLLSLSGENIELQIDEKREELEKISSEISSTIATMNDLNYLIQQLSSAESKCPLCDSILTSEKRNLLMKQKEEQLKNLKENLENLKTAKEKLSENIKKLEDSAKRISELYIQVKDLQDVEKELTSSERIVSQLDSFLSEARDILNEVKSEVEEIERKIKENEEKKRRYEIILIQLQDLEEKRNRRKELEKEIEGIKEKLREVELKLEGKDLAKMEENLKDLVSMESEIRTKLHSCDFLIQEKELRKKEYEEKLEDLEKMKKEVKKLESLLRDLEIFIQAVEETQIELRNNFVEIVNSTMNKLWNTLYPYRDFVAIRLNTEEGDYILQLQGRDGRWVNVEGNVSGGERAISCLALRIALALALAPHLKILVLDEPTANLDVKAISELAKTLRERINEFIEQTFLITHQAELEDAATGSVYKLEREKERDEPTRVVRID